MASHVGHVDRVPQGTKVGLVMFLAMINKVAELQPNRWKFMDDITVAPHRKPTANKITIRFCNRQ